MKKIKTVLILTILALKLSAQWPADGSYTTNNTMTAFHGTWQWVSGIDTVKIYMITQKTYFNINGGFYVDILKGWHIYKKGNTIIERSYDGVGNLFSHTLFLGNQAFIPNPNTNPNICSGTLFDITKNKLEELKLTLNTAGTQLTWKLTCSQGSKYRKPGDPPYDYGFTLPQNIVLTKQ